LSENSGRDNTWGNPKRNNPAPNTILDGVDVYLEHETRFELAFPSRSSTSHTGRSLIARVSPVPRAHPLVELRQRDVEADPELSKDVLRAPPRQSSRDGRVRRSSGTSGARRFRTRSQCISGRGCLAEATSGRASAAGHALTRDAEGRRLVSSRAAADPGPRTDRLALLDTSPQSG
jgi:hypothetical protein